MSSATEARCRCAGFRIDSAADKSHAGFTLTEVLISSALAATLMAAVLSSFVFIGQNLARLGNFQALENESRKALGYVARDVMLARAVKSGTTPTSSSVTLVLAAGEVSYTFDADTHTLTRQATFGAAPTVTLLHSDGCDCTAFEIAYFTAADGAPIDQTTPTRTVPYSVKQIELRYTLATPETRAVATRVRLDTASARFVIRNRVATDGT
jgi:prepilin-type N-terminal cleavage/methylation domain-containing protein